MIRTRRFIFLAAVVLLGGVALAQSARSAPPVSDPQITSEVVAHLANYDPAMARLIHVSTQDGVVTLSGYAYSSNAVGKAVRIASSIEGVVKVDNRLYVMQ